MGRKRKDAGNVDVERKQYRPTNPHATAGNQEDGHNPHERFHVETLVELEHGVHHQTRDEQTQQEPCDAEDGNVRRAVDICRSPSDGIIELEKHGHRVACKVQDRFDVGKHEDEKERAQKALRRRDEQLFPGLCAESEARQDEEQGQMEGEDRIADEIAVVEAMACDDEDHRDAFRDVDPLNAFLLLVFQPSFLTCR